MDQSFISGRDSMTQSPGFTEISVSGVDGDWNGWQTVGMFCSDSHPRKFRTLVLGFILVDFSLEFLSPTAKTRASVLIPAKTVGISFLPNPGK